MKRLKDIKKLLTITLLPFKKARKRLFRDKTFSNDLTYSVQFLLLLAQHADMFNNIIVNNMIIWHHLFKHEHF